MSRMNSTICRSCSIPVTNSETQAPERLLDSANQNGHDRRCMAEAHGTRRKAVFLDRDGVINDTVFRDGKPRSPDHVNHFHFLPGVQEAAARLRGAGFLLVVVTNQPDVARGWLKRENVLAMNQKVFDVLRVDAVKACFHDNADHCVCRKPKPGMLLEAARELDIDLRQSFMVGDRFSDVEAGAAAGCRTILVGEGDQVASPRKPDARVASLLEAAEWILHLTSRFPLQ